MGEHWSPVMESANDTVVAISLPARSASWPTASVEPEFTVPVRKSTLLDLEQLFGLLHRDRGIGLLVLEGQLDLAAHDAAGGIDFLGGELEAPAHLLADAGIGAGQRRHHADLDRVGGIVRCSSAVAHSSVVRIVVFVMSCLLSLVLRLFSASVP